MTCAHDSEEHSEKVEQQLRSAGWFPGRRIDTTTAVQQLTAHGFGVTELGAAVLAEFAGLSWYGISGGGILNFEFDVAPAVSVLSVEKLARYDHWLGYGPGGLTPFGWGDGYIALASDYDVLLLGDLMPDYLTFPGVAVFLRFVFDPGHEPHRALIPPDSPPVSGDSSR